LIGRLLDRDADARPPSALAVLDELDQLASAIAPGSARRARPKVGSPPAPATWPAPGLIDELAAHLDQPALVVMGCLLGRGSWSMRDPTRSSTRSRAAAGRTMIAGTVDHWCPLGAELPGSAAVGHAPRQGVAAPHEPQPRAWCSARRRSRATAVAALVRAGRSSGDPIVDDPPSGVTWRACVPVLESPVWPARGDCARRRAAARRREALHGERWVALTVLSSAVDLRRAGRSVDWTACGTVRRAPRGRLRAPAGAADRARTGVRGGIARSDRAHAAARSGTGGSIAADGRDRGRYRRSRGAGAKRRCNAWPTRSRSVAPPRPRPGSRALAAAAPPPRSGRPLASGSRRCSTSSRSAPHRVHLAEQLLARVAPIMRRARRALRSHPTRRPGRGACRPIRRLRDAAAFARGRPGRSAC
jgi:hypothetical protein